MDSRPSVVTPAPTVDVAAAGAAGGDPVSPADDTDRGGYPGYFADPGGHLREVVVDPFAAA